MGRPIKEKFFGNTNSPFTNFATGGTTGKGGEGFSSLVVTNTATNSGYSTSTTVIWTASAPQTAGGIAATGTASVSFIGGTGRIQALNVTTAGSGYTSTSSVTLTYSPTSAGTATTFVLSLTASQQNAISGQAYIVGGSANAYDIKKQEASRRYLVQTSDGTGQCKLVTTSTLTSGQMNIVATDVGGSTYFVKKLTARRAVLISYTVNGSFEFVDNSAAKWTLGSATTGTVSLASI
jgi:hypothetical protein